MVTNLDAALSYLARGWCVIPVHSIRSDRHCTCSKTACTAPGKHSRLLSWKEFQSEPPSIAQVTEWWTKWPQANIAIVTGHVSGLVVIDVDHRHGGDISVKTLSLAETVTALTGGGGEHYYFAHPG